MIPATAVILTKNSSRHLAAVLKALSSLDDILILDNGSTDNTLDIVRSYPNTRIHTSPFIGFGPLKNLGAEHAKHDWILSIDSDEIPDIALIDSIAAAVAVDRSNAIYTLNRLNHYRGRPIKACGWYPDILPRLYRKTHTCFTSRQVHESLIIPPNTNLIPLTGTLQHYSFEGAEGLLAKMQHYTSLFAQENRGKKTAGIPKAITHGCTAFLKNYLLKKGILYGADGFTIAVANAQGAYYKYIKLKEANDTIQASLIITTYNRPDALTAVIHSAFTQTVLPKEIIIADDGSDQNTADAIAALQTESPTPLIHSWHPDRGFRLAESRNRAIAQASADYIIMIDGDILLHPHFISDHLAIARKGRVIQGSRALLNPDATAQILQYPGSWHLTPTSSGLAKRHAALRLPLLRNIIANQGCQKMKGIKGCNLGFFKSDAISINGFNNDFVGWGREDSEFFVRCFNHGFKRHNLKFGGIGYHLYHPENDRGGLPENDALLQAAITQHKTWCQNGLDQYLNNESRSS